MNFIYDARSSLAKQALKDITFSVEEGQSLAIVGPVGSGKSTLAQIMAGLLQVSNGEVFIEGSLLGTAAVVKDIWKKIGFVFQSSAEQFFEKNVFSEVAYGLKNLNLPKLEIAIRVQEALSLLGLDYKLIKDRSPFALSGSEMKKVAIATVLAIKTKVLILDEPTVGLDYSSKNLLFSCLKALKQEKKITVILVTHDLEEVSYIADRVIALKEGRMVFDAAPYLFFDNEKLIESLGLDLPQDLYIKKRLASCGYQIDANMPLSAVKDTIIRQVKIELS